MNIKDDGKRFYKRIEKAYTVCHRLYERDKSVNQHKWRIATIDNLGEGGLLFSSDCCYHVDDTIEMKIELSNKEDVVCLKAKIRRVDSRGKDGLYPTAVEFINYDEYDRGRVKKAIGD